MPDFSLGGLSALMIIVPASKPEFASSVAHAVERLNRSWDDPHLQVALRTGEHEDITAYIDAADSPLERAERKNEMFGLRYSVRPRQLAKLMRFY
jgi:hypothetical protein